MNAASTGVCSRKVRCSPSIRFPTGQFMAGGGNLDRQQIGRAAEEAAAKYLEAQQLKILMRNYRCRSGEIDIVAETISGVVVIAEVRLRATTRYGAVLPALNCAASSRRLQHLATCSRAPSALCRRLALRFDVLDLVPDGAGSYRIATGFAQSLRSQRAVAPPASSWAAAAVVPDWSAVRGCSSLPVSNPADVRTGWRATSASVACDSTVESHALPFSRDDGQHVFQQDADVMTDAAESRVEFHRPIIDAE